MLSFKIDEDDPDLLALREIALSSLVTKEKKRVLNDGNHSQNFQQDRCPPNFSYSANIQELQGPHMQFNRLTFPQNRPGFRNEPYLAPVCPQPFFNPVHRQLHPRPSFGAHPQPFVSQPMPHFNPNFISTTHDHQIPQRFVPTASEMSGPLMAGRSVDKNEDISTAPAMNGITFEPTPPSRLSPRSALFVAENNKALQRQRRRSFTSRSRSKSPYGRYLSRSRSRSSPYKGQISHIVRKRSRSKTPNKYNRKSRSPRHRSRSLEKHLSPKNPAFDRHDKKSRSFRQNVGNNRDRNGKHEKDNRTQDRRGARSPPRNYNREKTETSVCDTKAEKTRSSKSPQQPTSESNQEDTKQKRVKTEQELEDELLASTDSEASVKGDDEDEFKVTLDENELDFLDDDEEESENEGRFKSKSATTAESRKPAITNNFKPSFQSRNNEKFKNDRNFSRNDYKRSKYIERNKRNSRSRSPIGTIQRARGSSPRKSPEVVAHPSKVLVIKSKEKADNVKEEPRKVKAPMFKSTFKTLDQLVEDKPKGKSVEKALFRNNEYTTYVTTVEATKKDDRVRLVRGSVINTVGKYSCRTNFVETLFTYVSPNTEGTKVQKATKKKDVDEKRPLIMRRLGGYASQKSSKSWAKEQVSQLVSMMIQICLYSITTRN